MSTRDNASPSEALFRPEFKTVENRQIGVRFYETSDWNPKIAVWTEMGMDVYLMIDRKSVNVGRFYFHFDGRSKDQPLELNWRISFTSIDRHRPTEMARVVIVQSPHDSPAEILDRYVRYVRHWVAKNYEKVRV